MDTFDMGGNLVRGGWSTKCVLTQHSRTPSNVEPAGVRSAVSAGPAVPSPGRATRRECKGGTTQRTGGTSFTGRESGGVGCGRVGV